MLTETHESIVIVDPDPTRPLPTNVAHFTLPRVGPRYPNILLTFRYRLVRKTGLFFYEKETDIECLIDPDGWDSTGSFNAPDGQQQKYMHPGNRIIDFSTVVFVKVHDAKVNVGILGNGAEFTPPQLHKNIKIEGYLDTRGHGEFKSIPSK